MRASGTVCLPPMGTPSRIGDEMELPALKRPLSFDDFETAMGRYDQIVECELEGAVVERRADSKSGIGSLGSQIPCRIGLTVGRIICALWVAAVMGFSAPARATELVQVSDIFMPYQIVGYSLGRHSNHKLPMDVAIDFGRDIQKSLPVTVRAELVVGRRGAVVAHEREFVDMSEVTRRGELEASGRRWKFDDLFTWEFFCERADRTLTVEGPDGPVEIGNEEIDFRIRVGVLGDPPTEREAKAGATRKMVVESIYQTPKRIRLVCGELTPLPR